MKSLRTILATAAATLIIIPGVAKHDKDNYNQWASMEFKQWSFTPKSYYYSWYMKDYGLFKTKVPGVGVHDKGPAGIGIGGDNYVNEPWRLMTPLRKSAVVESSTESSQEREQKNKWNEIFKKDLLTIADREVDAAYAITKDARDQAAASIAGSLTGLPLEGSAAAALEYARIKSNINTIHGAQIDNAKRLVVYQNENQALDNLQDAVSRAAMMHQIGKFISVDLDEAYNNIN